MTAAAAAFCCWIAIALADGFGSPAFTTVIASDAFHAAMPFLGVLVVARFAATRFRSRIVLVHRLHASVQGLLAAAAFGWWWWEPHSIFAALTGSSLVAMGWLAIFGGAFGLLLGVLADRTTNPAVMRELSMGSWIVFLIGGGRLYRSFDHSEAGTRISAALAIVAGVLALALAAWLLLRRRPRLAVAIPALAPAVAALALFMLSRGSTAPLSPTSRDSVLLVIIDTLRADVADGRFPADGNAMPELARIAGDGVRFSQAISPAPWTLPATVSLLSGWNPHRHHFGATASDWEVLPGDPKALYLAGAMQQAGYLTAAFLNNPYLRPWFGFGPGFYLMRPYHGRAFDGVALALDWLHDHLDSPSFTVLHLMDPHWPYDAPAGFGAQRQSCAVCDSLFLTQFGRTDPQARAEVMRRYAAEVRYTDAMLGRFYDTLSKGGALEHTWFVVTSDHGEEFWEHGGFMHGHSLFDELLRVPLVIVPPAARKDVKRSVRVDDQVRLEDVAATILDVAGIDRRQAPDGRSLLGLVTQVAESEPRVSIAGFIKSPTDLSWAVRRPPWKIFGSPVMSGNRLFDLSQDAGEERNLLFNAALSKPELTVLDRTYFALANEPRKSGVSVLRERAQPGLSAPEADTQRQLRSLGYTH